MFCTSSEVPVTAAIVPEAPGRVLGGVDGPEDEPVDEAAVVEVVDAAEEPPQAAKARPAAPTAPRTAS